MRTSSLLVLLACGPSVLAYSAAPPQSFAKAVPGGKFFLVMLQPEGRDFKDDLRKKYGKSGLYAVGDPKSPVWTCDWCADYERNVVVTEGGEWVVRVTDVETGLRHWLLGIEGRPAAKPIDVWQDRPAVMVYRRGQLVHTLAVKDVFDPSRFTDRDLFMGPVLAIDAAEPDTGRVRVVTTHADGSQQTAMVDARTGEVVDRDAGRGGWFTDCGNNGPSLGWERWAAVLLIGLAVVAAGAGAVAGLTALLVRRQAR